MSIVTRRVITYCFIFLCAMGFLKLYLNQEVLYSCLGSFIISLISIPIADPKVLDKIIYFSKREVFKRNLKKTIDSYQESFNIPSLVSKLKIDVKKYFEKEILDKKFIDKSSDYECAALMFAMQDEKNPFTIAPDLSVSDFREIARKAAMNIQYRTILLSNSLQNLGCNNKEILLLNDNKYHVAEELKSESDDSFYKRILASKDDEIIIFSTTSQVSSGMINIISSHHSSIKKFNFYICSPFILTHGAIRSMFSEYNNPSFATPKMQFIQNETGTVDIEMDATRRVLKIISSIHNLVEFSNEKKVSIEVNIFKKEYPGLKLKVLKNSKFIQIQPGNLSYANNLYRFGVETDSSSLFNDVLNKVNIYKENSEFVEEVPLISDRLNNFENEALSELTLWLLERGVTPEKMLKHRDMLMAKIVDDKFLLRIDKITNSLRKARDEVKISLGLNLDLCEIYTKRYNSCKTPGIFVGQNNIGNLYHITVATIFVKDNSLLMIRKSDKAYGNKLSIVAGHLENGESPVEAIIREVREEIGIKLDSYCFIKKEVEVHDKCRHGLDLHDWYIFYSNQIKDISNIDFDGTEIEYLEWVPLDKLSSMKHEFTQGASLIMERLGYISE